MSDVCYECDRYPCMCPGSRERYKQAYDELKAENERLKKYEEYIFDYVQGTSTTSVKYLGFHVADALVKHHQDLKAENEELKRKNSFLKSEYGLAKTQAKSAERIPAVITAHTKKLTARIEKLREAHKIIAGVLVGDQLGITEITRVNISHKALAADDEAAK